MNGYRRHRIALTLKKEWNSAICNNDEESIEHDAYEMSNRGTYMWDLKHKHKYILKYKQTHKYSKQS